MIGKTFSHYRILGQLGHGGMGVVYIAEDTILKRKVALKVLPDEVVSDPERVKRFQREAEVLAALNHPHIVTIHSVEEAEGTRFLTMEMVEGQTLDQLLLAGGLPIPRVLDISIALADALAAAHEKGIVHRDLKPKNIMLAGDGRVKVLDFGLATIARGTTGAPEIEVTHTTMSMGGAVMGTLPYMSPEQLLRQPVDHRTDIFSFGIVLYEMATGQHPFTGESSPAVASSILRDSPPPVTDRRSEVPQPLGHLVTRCLIKDREQRIQSMHDVRNALRALRKETEAGATTAPVAREPWVQAPANAPHAAPSRQRLRPQLWMAAGALAVLVSVIGLWLDRSARSIVPAASRLEADVKSIAVLPFTDLSPEGNQEYFADGLSEELLNSLANVDGLRVTGRTSSFSFKGKHEDLRVIGQKLNVKAILEGSVRKAGDRVRITAQLVDATDGFHLWSETYDRTLEDIFAVQEDIAHSVTQALRVKLVGTVSERKVGNTSPEAYNAYLQGQYFFKRPSQENIERAVRYYEQAIALDPNYALAWSGLSNAQTLGVDYAWVPADKGLQKAREALARALAIDANLAEAHGALAWLKMNYDWDWEGAVVESQRAVALAPENADLLAIAARAFMILGRFEEAMALGRQAVEIDPLNVQTWTTIGSILFGTGKYSEMETAYTKANELSPDHPTAHLNLGIVHLMQGRPEAALAEMERESHPAIRCFGISLALHALGRHEDSNLALRDLIQKHEYEAAFQIADAYAFRHESDLAFEWLERARVRRDPGVTLIKSSFLKMAFADDPRYTAFLNTIRMPA